MEVNMERFVRDIQIRWSDFDPNYHVRHTSYYDWGALSRVEFFASQNMSLEKMISGGFGPVLLREECVFRREIKQGDQVFINIELLKAKKDFSRWSIQHFIKKTDDTVAAIITIDGGFIDHRIRKLTIPSPEVMEAFNQMPKADAFAWIEA
jgi:acyl-CoA thioester hydrolase